MTNEERLDKLEQQLGRANRRNICFFLILTVFVAAWGIHGAIGLNTRIAQRVVEPHDEVKQIADVFTTKTLKANQIFLNDEKGNNRAMLSVIEGVPSIILFDKKDNARAMLALPNGDYPGLFLMDEKRNNIASLLITENGPSISLSDNNEKIRSEIVVLEDGPQMHLFDEMGKIRAELGRGKTVSPDGKETTYPESSLLLFGADGKVRWTAP